MNLYMYGAHQQWLLIQWIQLIIVLSLLVHLRRLTLDSERHIFLGFQLHANEFAR